MMRPLLALLALAAVAQTAADAPAGAGFDLFLLVRSYPPTYCEEQACSIKPMWVTAGSRRRQSGVVVCCPRQLALLQLIVAPSFSPHVCSQLGVYNPWALARV